MASRDPYGKNHTSRRSGPHILWNVCDSSRDRLLPLPFVHHVPHDRARLELLMVCTSGDYLRARDGAQLTGTRESHGRDLARAPNLVSVEVSTDRC